MMNNLYTGCVENRNDPLKLGRCQVRIIGLHTESRVTLPTEDLPWAYPMQPITSAGTSGVGSAPLGPVEGSWVLIVFMDPDQQMPMMLGTLAGAYQTPDAISTGRFQIDEADAAGNIVLTNAPQQQNADGTPVIPQPIGGAADVGSSLGGQITLKEGKVVTDPTKIVGPLGTLVAKAESGADGYNAFNRGTANGKIIPAGKKMDLTKMSIKDIMARQSLPAGDSERLFAVGKYQCIPITLKAACQALNIDINEPFSERTQDIICQEYLVGKKRPALIAYYRNPDRNNQDLLLKAGQSLAAEFASIEDPFFPGFPYKGQGGSYFKSGNRAKTLWERDIKPTLLTEWDFRNNKQEPPPTAALADNDKVEKGTDFSGVSKATPIDDSIATPPKSSAAAQSVTETSILPPLPALPDNPLSSVSAGINDLSSSLTGAIGSAIGDITSAIGGVLGDLDLDLGIDSLFSNLGTLSSDVADQLKQFGGNINEIASNLGIENITGSVTELSNNLGLYNATQEDIVKELAKKAGSTQGQAAALLAKLDTPEPTKPEVAPAGTANADGTISNGTGVDPTKGFQDPNGTYPKYKNEPDTNRLATGNNIGRTIVLKKEATLKTGIKVANGGTWDQSPTPYNATYPFNKVTQTESGHVQELDDTPGSERIHTYHKSGTFTEIDANGTQVNFIVGDGFQIMERNGFIYVKGAYCVTVDGAMNLRTDNVFNLEVSGAANIFVYNEANISVSKDCNLAVGATLNAKANTINLESEKQFNIKAGTGLNIQAGMDINFKSDASINTQALANISNKSTGAIFSQADGDINQKSAGIINIDSAEATNIKAGTVVNVESADSTSIKAGASIKQESGGTLSLKAGGNLSADAGGIVDIANGSSESADSATAAEDAIEARDASFAEIELPVETRGTSGVDRLPPMAVSTRGSEIGLDAPEGQGSATDSGAANYQSTRIQTNQTSQAATDDTKFEKSKEVPRASSSASTAPVAGLDSIMNTPADQYTAGMKLSKHFTLGDLTKGGVRIPRVTYTDKNGVKNTPQTIVANLKNLCVNALDPIRDNFGPFTITSGFRRPPFGAAAGDLGVGRNGRPIQEGGDHVSGCAVDIVFPGGKQDTYNKAKLIAELLPSWAQIIMEYNGKSFWVHVAVRQSGNKGDMFTMVSHKTFQGTFPRGGFILV